jgi:hypothetical protein
VIFFQALRTLDDVVAVLNAAAEAQAWQQNK